MKKYNFRNVYFDFFKRYVCLPNQARKECEFKMIDKELIELQKGCVATCVVIQNEDIKELNSKIVINSDIIKAMLKVKKAIKAIRI